MESPATSLKSCNTLSFDEHNFLTGILYMYRKHKAHKPNSHLSSGLMKYSFDPLI